MRLFSYFFLHLKQLRQFCRGNPIFSPVILPCSSNVLLAHPLFLSLVFLFWLLFLSRALSDGSQNKKNYKFDRFTGNQQNKNRQMHFNSKKICAVHDNRCRRHRKYERYFGTHPSKRKASLFVLCM